MSSKTKKAPQGLVLIISAPSGCGKTTIVERLMKRHPDWIRSVSATTRAARPGEKSGGDYVFLSPSQFEAMKKKGEFLEYAKVHENLYGTPKDFVLSNYEKGKTVVLAIDVQGMQKVRQALGDKFPLLALFILPPSMKILRERLEGRKTEAPEVVEKRLQGAEEEIKQANLYQYTVVNQNVEQTVLEIDELINQFQKERK